MATKTVCDICGVKCNMGMYAWLKALLPELADVCETYQNYLGQLVISTADKRRKEAQCQS